MIRIAQRLFKLHRTATLVAIGAAGSLAAFAWMHSSHKAPSAPTFAVERSEFVDALQFRGDLKARKSITISAPSDAGSLQILKIAPDGSSVKKGDMVVEFDPSRTTQELAQDRSVLKSANAETEQVRA